MNFEEMTPLGASGRVGGIPTSPMRPMQQFPGEPQQEMAPRERKKLQTRTQNMIKEQKKVERRVYGKSKGLPFVKRGKSGLVKARQAQQIPVPDEQMQRNGDWEFI